MRRHFLIISMMAFMSLYAGIGCSSAQEKSKNKPEEKNDVEQTDIPKVYMFKAIDSENLVKIYEALGREATGKVAVKLSTGEPGGHNFLQPALIKDLIQKVDGTIVECNTAYGGGRANTESHRKAAEDHGFTAIAPVDIMDAEGEIVLPLTGGKHLKHDIVGSHYLNYDLRLSCHTLRDTQWEVSAAQSRTCPSVSHRPTASVTSIRQEQVQQAGEALNKTISLNQWQRLQKQSLIIAETKFFTLV